MTGKRKITVDLLIVIALTILLLIPMMWLSAVKATADETTQTVAASGGDYVFFIVDQGDVPLAAVPSTGDPSYVLWICLSSAALMVVFIYTGWYLTVRKNLRELSDKLLPVERKAYRVTQGYLHPIRCYQLAKEAEDQVASIYNKYF